MRRLRHCFVVLIILLVSAIGLTQEPVEGEVAPEAWEYFVGTWITESPGEYTYIFEVSLDDNYSYPDLYVRWARFDPILTLTLATGRAIVFDHSEDKARYAVGELVKNNAVGFPYDAYVIFSRVQGSLESDDDKLAVTVYQYEQEDPSYDGNMLQVMTLTRLPEGQP